MLPYWTPRQSAGRVGTRVGFENPYLAQRLAGLRFAGFAGVVRFRRAFRLGGPFLDS